jgi:hypothetical protein
MEATYTRSSRTAIPGKVMIKTWGKVMIKTWANRLAIGKLIMPETWRT